MAEMNRELTARLAELDDLLAEVLDRRAAAEAAVADAETTLSQRQADLQGVLDEEGALRGSIGDLHRAIDTMEKP
jgi:hypothetical protein